MKKMIALSLVAAAFICGCDTDKSDDVEVMPAKGGAAYDAPKGGSSPSVPSNVKGEIPGG